MIGRKRKNQPGYQLVKGAHSSYWAKIDSPEQSSVDTSVSPGSDFAPREEPMLPPAEFATPLVEERGIFGRKATIALDIDGTLGDYYGHLRSASARHISAEDPEQFNLVKSGRFRDMDEFLTHHSQAMKTAGDMKLIDDNTVEAIGRIKALGHEVVIVTSRLETEAKETIRFLEKNDIDVDRVYITGGHNADKTEIAHYDCILDDAPHNIDSALDTDDVLPVVLNQRYNQDIDPEVPRVNTVSDFATALENNWI